MQFTILLRGLRAFAVPIPAACIAIAGFCGIETPALADACTDLKSQYAVAYRDYRSSTFRFPEDCARVDEYVRTKHQQAQSLISLSHSAERACGTQMSTNGGPSIEQIAALLDHDTARIQSGCSVIAATPDTAPPAEPPPAATSPAVAAPTLGTPPTNPAPTAQPVAAPANVSPPSSQQPVAGAPAATAPAIVARPAPVAGVSSLGAVALTCTAQKAAGIAPGCNADFPQRQTGVACGAADNSVGLTLQTPGAEPTCCVTACVKGR